MNEIISSIFRDSSAINNHPTFNSLDKVVALYDEKNALYERMLKEKDSVIELLQEVVRERK